ncbi:MAG: glycosyltransferase family 2 protein [Campylobacteraceae bacterium]|jgi:glycosyltransferase involved in cell wall biosynthesis|nr:glycosyltransferase family 2 protein [Campylobacteraceae bacterium]
MVNLTIIILAKNEERNIIHAVQNAKKCTDNVLVIDSGSTDDTVILAQKTKAEVICRALDGDFATQRNFGLQNTNTKWVLYLDADERLDDKLIRSIKKAIEKNEQKQYVIKRQSIAFGQKFNYGVLRPDFVARMFPRESVQWVNKVHERPICDLPKETLKGHMGHYTYVNWEQYINKVNQYTTIWAQNAYENGKTTSIMKGFLHAFNGFFQMTFIRKGVLDGKIGFVLCCNHFFYTLLKYVKLYNLQKSNAPLKKK